MLKGTDFVILTEEEAMVIYKLIENIHIEQAIKFEVIVLRQQLKKFLFSLEEGKN